MYAVVRTDKMFGTDNRAGMVSVRYVASGAKAAIENGNVVKLDSLETGSREVYKAVNVAANSALSEIALVASPEMMYDEHKHNLDEFINEAGKIARGYRLHTGDIFSVTKEALDYEAAPAVGNIVELKAGTKLSVAASVTEGSTQVGKIIDKNVVGRYTYYVVEVK